MQSSSHNNNASDPLEAIGIAEVYEHVMGGLSASTHHYGAYFLVRCPTQEHDDHHPSCILKPKEEVWKCLACGAKGGKLGMVIAAGFATTKAGARDWLAQASRRQLVTRPQPALKVSQRRSDKLLHERLVATHSFQDKNGVELYQILRYEGAPPTPEQRGKRFEIRRPDGQGNWIYHHAPSCGRWNCPCKGVGPLAQVAPTLVPYRLLELLESAKEGKRTLLLVEGEIHADELAALGFVATSNAYGWEYEYPQKWLRYFKGIPRAIVLADADVSGRAAAEARAEFLSQVIPCVQIADLYPNQNNGADVRNWLIEHPDNQHERLGAVLNQIARFPDFGKKNETRRSNSKRWE